jgi:hypothetical protein
MKPQQDTRRERFQIQCKKWPYDWWIVTKDVEHTTIAFLEKPQSVKETLNNEDVKKWEISMQEFRYGQHLDIGASSQG